MGKGQAYPICAYLSARLQPFLAGFMDFYNGFGQFSFTLTSACSSGGAVVSTHFSCGVHWDMGQASPYSQTNAA